MKAILYTSIIAAAASAFQLHYQTQVSLQKKITSKTILHQRLRENGDEEDNVDNNSTPSYELGRRKLLAALAPLPFLLNTHDASAYVDSRLCADTAEESRIKIFEAVAPSVVYIDTFTEKRGMLCARVYHNLQTANIFAQSSCAYIICKHATYLMLNLVCNVIQSIKRCLFNRCHGCTSW